MKISTRIIALVLVGFLVTFSVAGVAVGFMFYADRELDEISSKDLPLVQSLSTVMVRQFEQGSSLEKALRAGAIVGAPEPGTGNEAFEAASQRFYETITLAQDELRGARDLVQDALRRANDEERQAVLRQALSALHDIGLVQSQHADLAQRTFFLIEAGRPEEAAGNVLTLEAQKVTLSGEISGLVDLITAFAKTSAETTRQQQRQILYALIGVAGLGLALCVALGIAIGRSITRPVDAVTGTLTQLAEGNTDVAIDLPEDRGELSALAAALRSFRDEIIKRREVLISLAESERRFQTLAKISPVGVFYTDAEGNDIYINEKCAEITGLEPATFRNREWRNAIHPDDRERVVAEVERTMREDIPFRCEYRFVRPDGSETWVLGLATPHRDAAGRTVGIVGTVTDISEQKLAADKLLEHAQSRIRLHEITASGSLSLEEKIDLLLKLGIETFRLQMGIVSHIEDGVYTVERIEGPEGSPPAGTTFPLEDAYCSDTLKANGPIGFHHAGEGPYQTHPCYKKFQLEAYLGCPLLVDGKVYGTLNFSSPRPRKRLFDDAEFSLIQVFAQWIGYEISRSRAEHALRESEAQIRNVVDNVVDGIITIDDGGEILTANPAAARIFGYAREEMLGRNISMLMPPPHKETHDGYLRHYRETGEQKIIGHGREVEGLRRDGTVFPMDLAVNEIVRGDNRMFTGIIRDITERKQVERLKQEFVSSVSHELRTPLTSIRGALGLVGGGAIGKLGKENQALIDIALNNTQRLINLVNDILDLEKIGAGRMEFQFVRTDLAALIESTLAANKGYADEHGVRFRMTDTQPLPPVRLDEDRIRQVMANLLSNAAKFSPKGETVEVSVLPHGAWARVTVSDHGPGIPDAFRGRIFDRFSQADSSDTKKAGGTGLGLSISKAIIDRHGGDIGFDTAAGKGASFHFDLPIEEGPDISEIPRKSRRRGGRKRPPHVLICEDDPDIAKLLGVLLRQNGIETDIAPDATTAKSFLRQKAYDAMTVDIQLPDQDGLSLIQDIREGEATRNLPVVIVSVQAEEARNRLEGAALGILDWLEKPIDEDRLRDALAVAVQRSPKRKPRLLYVEDDLDLVEVLTTLVSRTAETAVATTLAEARNRLAEGVFDLVILDVTLPDGSGLDLLESLKDEKGDPTPVIVFSGQELDEDLRRQVDAALVKSRTSDLQLLKTIRSLVGPAGPAAKDQKEST